MFCFTNLYFVLLNSWWLLKVKAFEIKSKFGKESWALPNIVYCMAQCHWPTLDPPEHSGKGLTVCRKTHWKIKFRQYTTLHPHHYSRMCAGCSQKNPVHALVFIFKWENSHNVTWIQTSYKKAYTDKKKNVSFLKQVRAEWKYETKMIHPCVTVFLHQMAACTFSQIWLNLCIGYSWLFILYLSHMNKIRLGVVMEKW